MQSRTGCLKHRHEHRAWNRAGSDHHPPSDLEGASIDVVHVGLDHLQPITISCSGNMLYRICIYWGTGLHRFVSERAALALEHGLTGRSLDNVDGLDLHM